MSNAIFLLDANALITPYESYYPFDFAQSFWSQLEHYLSEGSLVILDMVRDEILARDDELKEWIEALPLSVFIDHDQLDIIQKYGEVLTHLQTNPCYQPHALAEWSRISVADAWLIAAAATRGYSIVTFEKRNNGLNSNSPSKNAKIPNVADEFDVETVNLFSMMRSLGFVL